MTSHREGTSEAGVDDGFARLGSNDGLFELRFVPLVDDGNRVLIIEARRRALYGDGLAWAMRLGPVAVRLEVLQSIARVANSIAEGRLTSDVVVVVADEPDLGLELQFLVTDAGLILGPGMYAFHLVWRGMGLAQECDLRTVIDQSCARELGEGLARVWVDQ